MNDLRILIVDDAPDIRDIVEEIINLRNHGWHVVADASDGAAGIDRARTEQPDLVLLDISMPVMDGIEALPELRKAAPKAVIVILTGFPSRAAHDQAIAAGADGFIEKDEIVHQLVPHLEAILAAVRPPPGRATEPPTQPGTLPDSTRAYPTPYA